MSPSGTGGAWRFRLLLGVGVLAIVALNVQLPGLNGPAYHQWPWRTLPALRVYGLLLLGGLPIGLALWAWERRRLSTSWTLASMAGGLLLLQLLGALVQTPDLRLTRVADTVFHKQVTSYFTDAIDLQDEPGWLAAFPERMGSLNIHSRNKPPGGILYYSLILHLFQRQWTAAAVGGLLIGLLAALSVPATYFFARALGASQTAAVYGAACLALTPSLILFFPEFDQAYAGLTALMLGAWLLAVDRGSPAWAALSGLTLALATFFSYSFLVLGTLFVAYGVAALLRDRERLRSILIQAVTVLGLLVLANLLIQSLTGYRQLDAFVAALHNQSWTVLEMKPRPYLPSLVFEPLDFALGVGYLPLLLAALFVARRAGDEFGRGAALAVLQLVVVTLTSLLEEAARVWLLLAPLLMPAAGAELERLDPRRRGLVLVLLLAIAASVARNLELITL